MSQGKPQLVGGSRPEEAPSSPPPAIDPTLLAGPWLDERRRSYLALLVLTAVALAIAYIIYRPFLTSLFLAVVLSVAFLPVHEWISRRVRGNTWAALTTTLAVVLLIMLPLTYVSIKLVSEAASLYNYISQHGNAIWNSRSAWLNEAIQRASEQTGMAPAQIKSSITARLQEVGAWLVSMLGWAARGLLQQVATAILALLILFFFLRDRAHYSQSIENLLPLPPGRIKELVAAMHETVISNLYGMVAVGVIQGSLIALGWWMVGLRAPLLWGAIATICSFVPLIGPSLVWWPGVLVLAWQGHWPQAVGLFAWGAIVVSSVDYIVRPRFASGRADANTLLVLLSLLGGLKAFGAVGIIAGPVVLSAVTALLRIAREERQGITGAQTNQG
jgi:predicted PurR-regulated permease PerM